MVSASQLRLGMVVRYENHTYRVVAAEYHPGQGKMGGVTHARLKNLSTGTFWEHSFRSELKLEEVASDQRAMDFLYTWIRRENGVSGLKRLQLGGPGEYRFCEAFYHR